MKRERNKVILYTFLLSAILLCIAFVAKLFPFTSLGADTTNMVIEANLQKYINYDLSDEDKGTLIQYEIKTKIEYGEEVLPVNEGQTIINLGQINGQYPYDVKVMIDNQTEYDASTGTLAIQSNQQDNADYVIIANYDTYTENNEERELQVKVSAKAVLANKENNEVSSEQQYNAFVTENVGDLTSIHCETQDIYNGYLKSNIINGTNYTTQYEQKEQIVVSKKEVQDTVEMLEDNTFIKQDMELGNNHNLVYKSTQIQKSDIERLLGQEGILEISDINGNIIVTINQDTEFGEDGTLNITYENEPEAIILKTSHITNEGILNLKHTKEIKNTMTDIQGTSIKTVIQMNGRQNSYEIMNELKETETNVNVDISSTNWTNNQQNDVTFDIYLDASTVKNSMFRNPCIYIELPSQVEKVILGNSSILYGNGLELQEPYIATNENGSSIMVVNLTGAQTEYYENSLGLMTNIKIEATVILNKEIETTEDIVKVTYTNEYVLDGGTETGNKEIPVKLESYQEENIPEIEKEPEDLEEQNNDNNVETVMEESNPLTYSVGSSLAVNSNDLKMEVTPVKGDTTIQNGDVVYEGEYIKYNVKVTNVSDKDIDDVKIVAMIPDGVTYGELEADYYTAYGKYEYNFDSSIKNKEIEIGTLEKGKSASKFYEVKVDNLPENEKEGKITTTIQSYVGEQVISDYQLTNVIKPAEVQVFLSAYTRTIQGEWNYNIDIIGGNEKEVTLQVKLPKEFVIGYYIIDGTGYEFTKNQISEDNVVTLTLPSGTYQISGTIERSLLTEETEDSQVELLAVAKVMTANNTYVSNENRIIYAYDTVSIQMTSANEGEEVKYGEEINYDITVTNTGKTNSESLNYASISINVIDFLPAEVNPVSMTYETWKQNAIDEEKNGMYTLTANFKKETVTEKIYRCEDENGKALEDINLNVRIPYQESITIQVRTTAGLVNQKTTIQNNATVEGTEFTEGKINVKTKTSNTIKHIILPYNYNDNTNNPDNPNNPSNPNDSNNSNGSNSTNNNKNSENRFSITGTAWMDKNEDGKRTSEETLLDAITVMLVDMKNSSVVKSTTKTSNGGSYQFLNLEEGNYLVIFKYDLDKYTITEYQKSGVDSSFNSDAIKKTITLNGGQVTAGVTDTIELSSSITNIDIGLIENKSCDFKIDKYISKVTVSTTSGTKEYTYDNTSLVKTEIKAKEINDATVSIEYKIVVTNEGEIAGTVNKIVDYLPNGLDFSSNINTNWAKSTNGELINTSIANQKIAIGESKELTLILTKKMTSESTGTFTNKAKIENATSTAGMTDNNSGNDTSSADIIISVSTGKAIIYISIILLVCVIIGIIIYLNRKYGFIRISKILMFLIVFMTIVCLQTDIVFAAKKTKMTLLNTQVQWKYMHSKVDGIWNRMHRSYV